MDVRCRLFNQQMDMTNKVRGRNHFYRCTGLGGWEPKIRWGKGARVYGAPPSSLSTPHVHRNSLLSRLAFWVVRHVLTHNPAPHAGIKSRAPSNSFLQVWQTCTSSKAITQIALENGPYRDKTDPTLRKGFENGPNNELENGPQ